MYNLVSTIDEIPFDEDRYIYVDTETKGLYGEVRLVQVYQTSFDKPFIFDTLKISLNTIISKLKDFTCVFHNAHYDLTCIEKQTGILLPNWEDTFLAGRLAFPHLESFSLDSMLEEVVGFNPYTEYLSKFVEGKDTLDKLKSKMQRSDWSKDLTEEQLCYAAIDVLYLPKLFEFCISSLSSKSYELDKKCVELMIEFQKTGLPYKRELIVEARKTIEQEFNNATSALPSTLNINSPKQVKEFLNVDSSNDTLLATLQSQGSEYAHNIRLARKAAKKVQFLDKYSAYTDRVTGYFNVTTKSGRSSCTEENLQQIPSALKGIFQTDKYFVYADFSNLELRTFAALIGEYVMAQKFANNEDLHSFTAQSLFGVVEVTKQQRQIAKTFNFSSLYGAGVAKRLDILVKNTGILLSEFEGRELANKWLQTYPAIKPWHNHNYKCWQDEVVGFTALGRPYKAKLYTDFGNILVQGTGAEVSKVALLKLAKALDISKLCVFIHDSYTFECDTLDEAKHYAKTLAHCMQEAWNEFKPYFKVNVDMPVEAVIAKNWADCQNGENIIWKYEI